MGKAEAENQDEVGLEGSTRGPDLFQAFWLLCLVFVDIQRDINICQLLIKFWRKKITVKVDFYKLYYSDVLVQSGLNCIENDYLWPK